MKIRWLVGATLLPLGAVLAAPVKCVVDGKTLYTDDQAKCAQSALKPIKGNVIISSSPNGGTSSKNSAKSGLDLPAGVDGLLQHLGITQQELEHGWQTVKDAQKRGSWQAPEMPED